MAIIKFIHFCCYENTIEAWFLFWYVFSYSFVERKSQSAKYRQVTKKSEIMKAKKLASKTLKKTKIKPNPPKQTNMANTKPKQKLQWNYIEHI